MPINTDRKGVRDWSRISEDGTVGRDYLGQEVLCRHSLDNGCSQITLTLERCLRKGHRLASGHREDWQRPLTPELEPLQSTQAAPPYATIPNVQGKEKSLAAAGM